MTCFLNSLLSGNFVNYACHWKFSPAPRLLFCLVFLLGFFSWKIIHASNSWFLSRMLINVEDRQLKMLSNLKMTVHEDIDHCMILQEVVICRNLDLCTLIQNLRRYSPNSVYFREHILRKDESCSTWEIRFKQFFDFYFETIWNFS